MNSEEYEMQAYPSGTAKMEQLCFPPPPPPPLPRPSFMPPPPPPLSHSPKRYEPRGSSIVRPLHNRFPKSPDQRPFQRPPHLPFLLPPPPPKFRNQAHRQQSSPTAQYRSEPQTTSLQRRNRDGKDDNSASVALPATEGHLSYYIETSIVKETEDTPCDVKDDELEDQSCTSVEDNSSSRTQRKRQFERLSDIHSGLPKELTQKFGALTCELCSVSVNSTVQARMHYTGKQHEKKVHSFLLNWSKETGEPMPKQFKDGLPKKNDPHLSFCEVCNIPLTSAAHASQHYMGNKHRRALAGRAAVKTKIEQGALPADDPTRRFGIGVEFQPYTNSDPLGLKSPEQESPTVNVKTFVCELCKVVATSQDQLDMHLRGAKHRKAEAANKQRSSVTSTTPQATQSDSILESVMQNLTAVGKDYSIYRTPSGYYYCQPCNLTLNSEAQFIQHCESKKHKAKITKKADVSPSKAGIVA